MEVGLLSFVPIIRFAGTDQPFPVPRPWNYPSRKPSQALFFVSQPQLPDPSREPTRRGSLACLARSEHWSEAHHTNSLRLQGEDERYPQK